MERFCRATPLLTEEGAEKLKNAKALLFGVGGVGGYAAEALIRCGVGRLDIVDGDTVALSNINRQIIALTSTLGRYKAEVFAKRAKDINPKAQVTAYNLFFNEKTAETFDFSTYDYIIDAVDDVAAKTEIIVRAVRAGVPVISAMGAGNKLDPTLFKVADISKTSVCPLARVMRKKLKERGVTHCKVVFSTEKTACRNVPPASVSFVPSVAGLIIAGEVARDLCGVKAGVPAI